MRWKRFAAAAALAAAHLGCGGADVRENTVSLTYADRYHGDLVVLLGLQQSCNMYLPKVSVALFEFARTDDDDFTTFANSALITLRQIKVRLPAFTATLRSYESYYELVRDHERAHGVGSATIWHQNLADAHAAAIALATELLALDAKLIRGYEPRRRRYCHENGVNGNRVEKMFCYTNE